MDVNEVHINQLELRLGDSPQVKLSLALEVTNRTGLTTYLGSSSLTMGISAIHMTFHKSRTVLSLTLEESSLKSKPSSQV